MNTEELTSTIETALDPETFDIVSYAENSPVALDTVEIYMNLPAAKERATLIEERTREIAIRREEERQGKASSLSISDNDEDTEFDARINELTETLEKTKAIFHLKSVAPSLEKAIKKSYVAKADPNADAKGKAAHENRMYADILSRAMDFVELGDGREDRRGWDSDRLQKLQENLHDSQSEKLLEALSGMVYVGKVFEESLTVDF